MRSLTGNDSGNIFKEHRVRRGGGLGPGYPTLFSAHPSSLHNLLHPAATTTENPTSDGREKKEETQEMGRKRKPGGQPMCVGEWCVPGHSYTASNGPLNLLHGSSVPCTLCHLICILCWANGHSRKNS